MPIPSAIALTSIADSSLMVAADERNNFAAIQTAVNALIDYLSTLQSGGITGRISAAGAIVAGSGFTAARNALGQYTVTFTVPFAAAPTVLVAGTGTTFTSQSWLVNPSTTQVVVYGQTGGIGPVDQAFNFLAVATV